MEMKFLVPALTPIMCGTSVHLAGGVPIYVDVDKKTFLIDYNDLEKNYKKQKLYWPYICTVEFVI